MDLHLLHFTVGTSASLTNRGTAVSDGSVSVKTTSENGLDSRFELVSNTLVLTNPSGTGASSASISVGDFVIREILYTANSRTYAVEADFEAQATVPTLEASDIEASFTGSSPTVGLASTTFTVGTSASLTNRDSVSDGSVSVKTTSENGLDSRFELVSNTLVLTNPSGTGASSASISVGDFVIREILYTANSRTYAVEADFEAQATVPTLEASDIEASFTGSSPTVGLASTTFTVGTSASLTNRDSVSDGSVSVKTTSENGLDSRFELVSNTLVLTNPSGTGASSASISVGDFVIREILYTANSRTYAVEADFEAQATVPTLEASDIEASFTGSSPTVGLASTTFTVGTSASLTNRDSVSDGSVSVKTTSENGLDSRFELVSNTLVLTNPSGTGASSASISVGDFVIREILYTANSRTYAVEADFEAQATVPTLEASDIEASFTGSSPTVGLASTTFTVGTSASLTNRDSVSDGSVSVKTTSENGLDSRFELVSNTLVLTNPSGTGASSASISVGDFVIREILYTANSRTYAVEADFEAQATVPTLEASDIEASFTGSSPTVGLASTTFTVGTSASLTNRDSVSDGSVSVKTTSENGLDSRFELVSNTLVLTNPSGTGASSASISVGDFVIREILYTANSRTYAVEADFEAQATAPAVSTIGAYA